MSVSLVVSPFSTFSFSSCSLDSRSSLSSPLRLFLHHPLFVRSTGDSRFIHLSSPPPPPFLLHLDGFLIPRCAVRCCPLLLTGTKSFYALQHLLRSQRILGLLRLTFGPGDSQCWIRFAEPSRGLSIETTAVIVLSKWFIVIAVLRVSRLNAVR